jgi:pilus assembly protein CpaE
VIAGDLRFLLLLDDDVSAAPIRAALPENASVEVVSLSDAQSNSGRLVDKSRPDIALVGCTARSNAALEVIGELSKGRGCPTVVLFAGTPNGFMSAAFAAGAADLIVLPQPHDELAFALEKAIARFHGESAADGPAPIISILGPKGGTGKTLTACNLAVALAKSGAKPIVVDLDLQFGDVGLALGLKPERTIYDLATAGGTLDLGKVASFVVDHPSGARALLAPTRPDQAAAIDIDFLRSVFEILRMRYDYVIVDTPPAFSPEVIAAIDASTHLCVVGMLDALSLKDTKIGLETLERMGYRSADTVLVLNRADSSVGISQAEVEQLLGKKPEVLVPSDRAIPRALTSGHVIVESDPKSGAARAFTSLAELYAENARREAPALEEETKRTERRPARLAFARRGS